MASAQQILDYCKSLSSYELKQYAKRQYNIVHNYLTRMGIDSKKADLLLFESVLICVALDSEFEYGEWQLVKYLFDAPDREFSYIRDYAMDLRSIKTKREMSEFCHQLKTTERVAYISLCIATMVSDGVFTYDDLDFLEDCLL